MSMRIGVDIGGTKILAAVVDDGGQVLASERVPSPRQDSDAATREVIDAIERLRAGAPGEIESIGLGVAALVDFDRTKVITAPNLGWANVSLGAVVSAATGLPTVVENDGNAAAWGEFVFGAGRHLDDVVVVTVGTGIGGGLIMRGVLRRGAHGGAAEIGHMNAVPDGLPCGCGRNGCWEQYASGNALVRQARQLAAQHRREAAVLLALGDGTPEGVQGRHITQAAQAGDVVARQAFDLVGMWLGRGLADLVAIIDPQAFIIGGGVSEAGDLLLMSARSTLAAKVIGGTERSIPPIIAATLGNDAGVVGAADLARQPR